MSSTSDEGNEAVQWISLSDMMSALMMVFLLMVLLLLQDVHVAKERIQKIAVSYQQEKLAIYDALVAEFYDDLKKWDATIVKDSLTFTFNSSDLNFSTGSTELSDKYKEVLNEFLPRYLKVIYKFENSITEVLIEGHTSSQWLTAESEEDAYFKNMELSQGRTRSVLRFLYTQTDIKQYQSWIKKKFSAIGFSYARTVSDSEGQEDQQRSRRVNFRVVTNADIKLEKIITDNKALPSES